MIDTPLKGVHILGCGYSGSYCIEEGHESHGQYRGKWGQDKQMRVIRDAFRAADIKVTDDEIKKFVQKLLARLAAGD